MNHPCLLYLTGTFLFCIRGTFRYVGRGAAHAVCAPARHSQATTKDKAFDHAKKSPRGASTLRPCQRSNDSSNLAHACNVKLRRSVLEHSPRMENWDGHLTCPAFKCGGP